MAMDGDALKLGGFRILIDSPILARKLAKHTKQLAVDVSAPFRSPDRAYRSTTWTAAAASVSQSN
jgi:hypothetical protein